MWRAPCRTTPPRGPPAPAAAAEFESSFLFKDGAPINSSKEGLRGRGLGGGAICIPMANSTQGGLPGGGGRVWARPLFPWPGGPSRPEALQLNRSYAKGYVLRGLLKKRSFQDLQGAMDDFDRAIAVDPGRAPPTTIFATSRIFSSKGL